MDDVYTLHRGTLPLLISLPHDGIALPEEIAARVTDAARGVPDTDWFVSRLYAFARELGASLLIPSTSRYVVDLNRPSDNQPMYPGQNNTELCPTRFFTGEPLYRSGCEPDSGEGGRRTGPMRRGRRDRQRDLRCLRCAGAQLSHDPRQGDGRHAEDLSTEHHRKLSVDAPPISPFPANRAAHSLAKAGAYPLRRS